MKSNYCSLIIAILMVMIFTAKAETVKFTVHGIVIDEETKEPLPGASVMLQDHSSGTVTDINGHFSIDVVSNDYRSRFVVSYVGYEKKEVEISNDPTSPKGVSADKDFPSDEIVIRLRINQKMAKEVVVSASRIPERIMESPVTIEKITAADVKETPANNFYESIGYAKSVDVVTSGIAFKTINIRGFGNTEKPGFVQLVDGMDNQSPGLSYSMGYGINDLDVDNVEMIPGTSSALYGANAFNGMMNITSKNPFKYQGVSVQLKNGFNQSGTNSNSFSPYYDYQARFAKALSKHFAFKVNAEFFQAQDWMANDKTDVSLYKPTGTETNKFDPSYDGLNVYGDEVNYPLPIGTNGAPIVVARTGYDEKDLTDYNSHYTKLDGSLHYRFTDKIEASYTYKYSLSTNILHSVDRYQFKDFGLNQQKVELTAPNFFVRAYTSGESSGKTYDMRFLAINMDEAWKNSNQWFTDYATAYGGGVNGVTAGDFNAARAYADIGRPLPGTPRFNQLRDSIIGIKGFANGGASFDEHTRIYNAETQYDWSKQVKFVELLSGTTFRYYNLNSNGTLWPDTAGNPLNYKEYGAYTQVGKKLLSDKLKLTASLRYDKSQNYDGQFSPRIAAVYNLGKDNFFRASYQTGFRMPSAQEQYINLNLGFMQLLGGLPAIVNPYDVVGKSFTQQSVTNYANDVNNYVNQYGTDSASAAVQKYKGELTPLNVTYVKPERVQSFEVGYKGLLSDNNFFYDLSAYYTINHDFIGFYNVVRPQSGSTQNSDSITSAAYSLVDPTQTAKYYQLTMNMPGNVNTYGVALGLTYNLPRNYVLSGNVTYSKLDQAPMAVDGRTMYNTPTYKTNIGLSNRNVRNNIGFAINWKWRDNYKWESLFGDGMLAATNSLDAQISYKMPKMATTFKIGATNLLNHRYTDVYGGGTLGGMYYVSLLYDGIFK